ncbi:hypothetical protein FNW52_11470 [Flavobacterium sp. ZT3R18]|uniref:DKNYY domain-containing protein n=1 Tax=Flavobacterium sp. ZT3R18 TaxID=2594429 RepID=UPI00117A3F9E|nr:DKNYY domain-containing protein [Flavobacterium sp. ZT3R18]TRX35332.1 hypothetical protein FNW52_11470 [Flavobacterium sp. ZT3R18]
MIKNTNKTVFLMVLVLLFISCTSNYKIEGDRVYYQFYCISFAEHDGGRINKTALKNVDASSFKSLDNSYGSDKSNVYYYEKKIIDANPQSFEIILFEDANDSNSFAYSKDENYVFRYGIKINGANPKTFKVLNQIPYSRDDTDYFFEGKPLNVNDVNSLRIITESRIDFLSIDNKSYYLEDKKYPLADYKSFKYLSSGYFKDNVNVYFLDSIVKGADPKTFEASGATGQDKNYYYKGFEKHKQK